MFTKFSTPSRKLIVPAASCRNSYATAAASKKKNSKKQLNVQNPELFATHSPPPPPYRGFFDRIRGTTEMNSSTGAKSVKEFEQQQAKMKKWDWLLKATGYQNEENTLFVNSSCIYHSCLNQVAQPSFFEQLQLQPDFRGHQALLMIHIWMVHRRLIKEGKDGKILQEQMFDRLWEQSVLRLRYQNVAELTVNKYLKEVQQISFTACVDYDKGVGSDLFTDKIQKHLLNVEKVPSQNKKREALLMTEYVHRELKTIEKLDFEQLSVGAIPWGNLSSENSNGYKNQSQKGKRSNDGTIDLEQELIGRKYGDWRSALDNRGKVFYWNTRTRQSVWKLPEDLTTKLV